MFANVIWEGRFQPIHRAHVEYIRRLLTYGTHVWVFVVENEVSTSPIMPLGELPVPEFTAVVDEHHGVEKNPLQFWQRLRLVQETIRAELPDAPVTVWGGRRLDLMWSFYSRAFPSDRIFLTPERDDFEDVKAAAWAKLGERVKRIDVADIPKISATLLRDRLESGGSISDLVCPSTEALLKEFQYLH